MSINHKYRFFMWLLAFLNCMHINAQSVKVGEIVFTNNVKSVQVIDSCRVENFKYVFDVKGRDSILIHDDDWEDRTVYTYDDNDNFLSSIEYRNNCPRFKMIYNYENGNVINFKEIIDDVVKLEELYFYSHNKLTEKHQIYEHNLVYIEKYIYKDYYTLILNTGYPGNVVSYSKEYKIDNIKTIESFVLSNTDKPSLVEKYFYNKGGHIDEHHEIYNGDVKVITNRNKDIITSKRTFVSDFILDHEVLYDNRGCVISDQYFNSDKNRKYINQYDNYENIILAEVYIDGIKECSISYKIKYY